MTKSGPTSLTCGNKAYSTKGPCSGNGCWPKLWTGKEPAIRRPNLQGCKSEPDLKCLKISSPTCKIMRKQDRFQNHIEEVSEAYFHQIRNYLIIIMSLMFYHLFLSHLLIKIASPIVYQVHFFFCWSLSLNNMNVVLHYSLLHSILYPTLPEFY